MEEKSVAAGFQTRYLQPRSLLLPTLHLSSAESVLWRLSCSLAVTEQLLQGSLRPLVKKTGPHGKQLGSLIHVLHPRLQVILTSVHSFLLVHRFVLLIGNNRCKTNFENFFHIFIHQPYYNESGLWLGLSLPFLILTLTQRALLVIKLYALHRKFPEKSIFISSGIFSNLEIGHNLKSLVTVVKNTDLSKGSYIN